MPDGTDQPERFRDWNKFVRQDQSPPVAVSTNLTIQATRARTQTTASAFAPPISGQSPHLGPSVAGHLMDPYALPANLLVEHPSGQSERPYPYISNLEGCVEAEARLNRGALRLVLVPEGHGAGTVQWKEGVMTIEGNRGKSVGLAEDQAAQIFAIT